MGMRTFSDKYPVTVIEFLIKNSLWILCGVVNQGDYNSITSKLKSKILQTVSI